MLIYGSQLISLPVGSLEENRMAGKIKKIIVDRNHAVVVGFIVHIDGLLGPNLFLSATDIVGADRNGLVTNKKDNFVITEEVLAAKKIIDERFNLFGLPARILRDNKRLGKIVDFVIETESFQIVKFSIKGLWQDRIFPLSEVHEITKKEIVFEKDIEEKKIKETLIQDIPA